MDAWVRGVEAAMATDRRALCASAALQRAESPPVNLASWAAACGGESQGCCSTPPRRLAALCSTVYPPNLPADGPGASARAFYTTPGELRVGESALLCAPHLQPALKPAPPASSNHIRGWRRIAQQ